MKKLLTLLGSVGLMATTGATVVACGPKNDKKAEDPNNLGTIAKAETVTNFVKDFEVLGLKDQATATAVANQIKELIAEAHATKDITKDDIVKVLKSTAVASDATPAPDQQDDEETPAPTPTPKTYTITVEVDAKAENPKNIALNGSAVFKLNETPSTDAKAVLASVLNKAIKDNMGGDVSKEIDMSNNYEGFFNEMKDILVAKVKEVAEKYITVDAVDLAKISTWADEAMQVVYFDNNGTTIPADKDIIAKPAKDEDTKSVEDIYKEKVLAGYPDGTTWQDVTEKHAEEIKTLTLGVKFDSSKKIDEKAIDSNLFWSITFGTKAAPEAPNQK